MDIVEVGIGAETLNAPFDAFENVSSGIRNVLQVESLLKVDLGSQPPDYTRGRLPGSAYLMSTLGCEKDFLSGPRMSLEESPQKFLVRAVAIDSGCIPESTS